MANTYTDDRRSYGRHRPQRDLSVRDICAADFDVIAARLDEPDIEFGSIEMISGRHPDYGRTILLRDYDRHLVLVEIVGPLDLAQAERRVGIGHA